MAKPLRGKMIEIVKARPQTDHYEPGKTPPKPKITGRDKK